MVKGMLILFGVDTCTLYSVIIIPVQVLAVACFGESYKYNI